MSRPQAVATVQIDKPRVIVTARNPGGELKAPLVAGESYTRKLGVEHNVIHHTDHEVVFIEIELR